ncbi:MAG: hypothetical protein U9R79_11330 [Armatimonadota bacterium]|nr:hypothetical protein [Armatimonadota bacterium]
MSSLRRAAGALVLLLAVLPASAQTQLAVELTEVEIEQFTNGVEITLEADGLLQVLAIGEWYHTDEDHSFELVLPNARSSVSTFVDVSQYPVNYLKLETPPQERVEELVLEAGESLESLEQWERVVQEGVGLILTVRLYLWGHVHSAELDNVDWGGQWEWDPGDIAYDLRKSRSGRELVITVWSDRRELLPEERAPRVDQDLPATLSIQAQDGTLAVDAVNVPLQQLMSDVAERAGVSIYVSDRVRRLATVHLADTDVPGLIEAVAAGLGLTASFDGDAWYVSDGLPSSLAPFTSGQSRTFRLKYLTADEAINLLPEFLLRYLRPSPTNDSITAHGPQQLLDRIESDLRTLDQPTRAVRLRLAVIEAARGSLSRRVWRLMRGGSTTIDVDGEEGSIRFRHGEEPIDRLIARVRALSETEDISVDVRPSLTVEPGQWAGLFSGEEQYYQFLRYGRRLDLNRVEAGVQLWVRPRATAGELIESSVSVRVANFRGRRQPPIIDTREVSSTVLLRSGDTMIIGGGLRLADRFEEDSGPMPFRDAWLLRDITERTSDSQRVREIIFLMSAEVVELRHATGSDEQTSRGDA